MTEPLQPLWSDNLDRLRDSLVAQANRIRTGSRHPTIKGTSLEVVLRRTLRDYLPGHFTIGSGQAANNLHAISPQLDIIVYDHSAFPHLAVNEDSSVIICCESILAAVECKTAWKADDAVTHFQGFCDVESRRHNEFAHTSNAAAYFVVVFEPATVNPEHLSSLQDETRFVGVYTINGNSSWSSPYQRTDFAENRGNALALFLQDILSDCMRKGQKELGTFTLAHHVFASYFGGESGGGSRGG